MAEQMAPKLLDVREELRAGREPLQIILRAVKELEPGQSLLLRATFEPIPLYGVLGVKGYQHETRRIDSGDWEVLFRPGGKHGLFGRRAKPPETPGPAARSDDGDWNAPVQRLDNRGLTPPEPMIRILSALEQMGAGEILEALNDREPQFLFPELEARGHAIRVEKQERGVRLLIRHST